MNQRDMALLIEVEDELDKMDRVLEQLAGHGHASGDFARRYEIEQKSGGEHYVRGHRDCLLYLLRCGVIGKDRIEWEEWQIMFRLDCSTETTIVELEYDDMLQRLSEDKKRELLDKNCEETDYVL